VTNQYIIAYFYYYYFYYCRKNDASATAIYNLQSLSPGLTADKT